MPSSLRIALDAGSDAQHHASRFLRPNRALLPRANNTAATEAPDLVMTAPRNIQENVSEETHDSLKRTRTSPDRLSPHLQCRRRPFLDFFLIAFRLCFDLNSVSSPLEPLQFKVR